jgi:cell wall-associated NlpC family hydrolase
MTIAPRSTFSLHETSIALDARVHGVRGDLADIALAGQIFVPHYARPMPMTCAAASVMLRASGNEASEAISQLLLGEGFQVIDVAGGWAWGYCRHDHYVGYVPQSALLPAIGDAASSVVTVREAILFADADGTSNTGATLPMGARISSAPHGDFVETPLGYVSKDAVDGHFADAVSAAALLIDVPYVWGGRCGSGIDCSGLVQLSLALTGTAAPRDTDQQEDALGHSIPEGAALQRGDIIFLPGHVGMMVDAEQIIHANIFHGKTVIEPLSVVAARYAADHDGLGITARKRLDQ